MPAEFFMLLNLLIIIALYLSINVLFLKTKRDQLRSNALV